MKLLEIIHPAAKTLVDISLSQDAEVQLSATVSACSQFEVAFLVHFGPIEHHAG